jgi:hypothetical protein
LLYVQTVSKEHSKYELDLLVIQEVRWDRGGTEPTGEYTFFYIVSAFKRVEFVSDRIRGRWCEYLCSEHS